MKYDIHQTANSSVFTMFSSIFTSRKDLEVDHGGGGHIYIYLQSIFIYIYTDLYKYIKTCRGFRVFRWCVNRSVPLYKACAGVSGEAMSSVGAIV